MSFVPCPDGGRCGFASHDPRSHAYRRCSQRALRSRLSGDAQVPAPPSSGLDLSRAFPDVKGAFGFLPGGELVLRMDKMEREDADRLARIHSRLSPGQKIPHATTDRSVRDAWSGDIVISARADANHTFISAYKDGEMVRDIAKISNTNVLDEMDDVISFPSTYGSVPTGSVPEVRMFLARYANGVDAAERAGVLRMISRFGLDASDLE